MRTPEEFKIQAEKLGLESWPIRECSICEYPMSYVFEDGKVFYDSGCDCVRYSNMQQRSWEDIADLYNRQQNPAVIRKFDEFWGFKLC